METAAVHSPLEEFVRDYVDVTGGVWDEIEPQVYDLLLPAEGAASASFPSSAWERGSVDGREIVRVAFDPEAIPEHPAAQLVSFGTPLMDRLFTDAMQRGRFARMYIVGLNLTPHDLASRVQRAFTMPADTRLHVERVRPLYFPQAVFWLQGTFVSDQKEQEIVPIALDLHFGRQVRHLDALLDHARLSETPSLPLLEARHLSLALAYPLAREQALRTVAALANARHRQQSNHTERQIARMNRYYADLLRELQDQMQRAADRGDDTGKFAGRREALEREEKVRVAELRQKSELRVQLRLLNVLVLQQAKLLIYATVRTDEGKAEPLELVWDPLTESLEAALCPQCQRPTFGFARTRLGRLACQDCVSSTPMPGRPSRR
jgi:hypothetical protein